jgi:nucleoside 2-deoxyribosyltransferase
MKVYISGPITNDPDHAEKFAAAFIDLYSQGHDPVSPVDIGRELKASMGREPTRYEYMRADIKAMMDCDAICMLPGFNDSWGAKIELWIAHNLHFDIKTL